MQNLDGLLPTGWTRHRARRRGAAGRWGAGAHRRGRWCAGLGAGALGRTGVGAGALGWALGRWAGRAAWAPGLALGSALGALGPFSIRFDSFFFPESPNEHRSL